MVLRDRKKLSEDGIVTAVVTLSKETGVFIDAQVVARGVSFDLSDADTINDVSDRLRRSLAKHASTPRNNEADAKLVRDVLASYLWESQHCRPMIVPFVMDRGPVQTYPKHTTGQKGLRSCGGSPGIPDGEEGVLDAGSQSVGRRCDCAGPLGAHGDRARPIDDVCRPRRAGTCLGGSHARAPYGRRDAS